MSYGRGGGNNEGIKNKPSINVFKTIVCICTGIVLFSAFIYVLYNAEYLGLFEIKLLVNHNTGEENGIIFTLIGYVIWFGIFALLAYAAVFLVQLVATMLIMGDRNSDFYDWLMFFSIFDKCVLFVLTGVMIFLEMFQIYSIF